MNKNTLKNLLLNNCEDDENTTVNWLDEIVSTNNCSCCKECNCIDKFACTHCGCECYCDFSDDETVETLDKELTNFNINIIEDNNKEKKIRITLEFNVILNEKSKVISIDVDINKNIYLEIANDLIK